MSEIYIDDLPLFREIRNEFFQHTKSCSQCSTLISQRKLSGFCDKADVILKKATRITLFAEMLGARFRKEQ